MESTNEKMRRLLGRPIVPAKPNCRLVEGPREKVLQLFSPGIHIPRKPLRWLVPEESDMEVKSDQVQLLP